MTRPALRVLRGGGVLALAALVVQLAGCALPAREAPGALRADVVARLGVPTASFPLPGGERLLYSELPAGFAAYNLDFDASGRLVRNEQVLTQARFENLPVGVWTAADVQRAMQGHVLASGETIGLGQVDPTAPPRPATSPPPAPTPQ